MSAPERPEPDQPEVPDAAVLTRVLDGLRALPEQTRRRPDGPASTTDDASVPLPRRR